MVIVKKNGVYGIIDSKGHQIIPFRYDFVYGIYGGMIWVELNGRSYFINDKEIIIYEPTIRYYERYI
jgi:hypothetical protein